MEKIIHSLLPHHWINVNHASDIAAARRAGQRMAQALEFDDTRTGQLAIVITEAATNMLKHAGEGRMLLTCVHADARSGIEVLALDCGPGIANLGQALRDGVSSAGTAGTGLGALRRLSDQFDVYAPRERGAVFFMRLWRDPAPGQSLPFGALCLPIAGEDASGDAWGLADQGRYVTLLMADGLGHGVEAAAASRAALDTLALQPGLAPGRQIEACHQALHGSRGAALAVARIDTNEHELCFAGVGNISACVIDDAKRRQMVSHNGIVGHNVRKVQEFTLACPPGALVILHSDGISTQWDLEAYPGLAEYSPAIIAAVLLRDFSRGRDDACVLVKRCDGVAP
ncbi:MAG: ATP-binding SpoIIE family protein phosphatase [Pseudomonadota bacterium]